MTETVQNGTRSGHVKAPASKSAAHRLLITAALSQEESTVYCDTMSRCSRSDFRAGRRVHPGFAR